MRRLIFNNVKRMIPKISDTEKIALNYGTTSIDRELFEGKVKDHKFELSENTRRKFEKEHRLFAR